MRKNEVKEWKTEAGLNARISRVSSKVEDWHCGYVGVPAGHPLFMVDYMDGYTNSGDGLVSRELLYCVHGGITYSGGIGSDGLWYFGFDCAHHGDSIHVQDVGYCTNECEELAIQLADFADKHRKRSLSNFSCSSVKLSISKSAVKAVGISRSLGCR